MQVDSKERKYDFLKLVIEWLLKNGMEDKVPYRAFAFSMLSFTLFQEDVVGASVSDLPGIPEQAAVRAFCARAVAFLNKANAEAPASGVSDRAPQARSVVLLGDSWFNVFARVRKAGHNVLEALQAALAPAPPKVRSCNLWLSCINSFVVRRVSTSVMR